MSSILYYSNYCKSSNRVLQILSKYNLGNSVHFVCIDGRINKNGNMYAVLPNGQEMLIPKNITNVPSLLILNQNYKVVSGVEDIINFFQGGIEQQVRQATRNNTVPVSTSADDGYSAFGGFGSGIVSDYFSFLDQNEDEMSAKGNGGLRQMHNYARPDDNLIYSSNINNNSDLSTGNKIKDGDTSSLLDKYKQERDRDLNTYKTQMGYK